MPSSPIGTGLESWLFHFPAHVPGNMVENGPNTLMGDQDEAPSFSVTLWLQPLEK